MEMEVRSILATMDEEKIDSGQQRLQELGYKQELKRSMSPLANVAMCFSVVSILTGVTPTYNTGLRYGGPVSIVYGWPIVCFFTTCIALSMAEICSAYPTSGGLYFWSYKLAGCKWGPFMAWMTGWFNIAGLWSGTASVCFSLALLLQVTILVSTGGANGGGYYASKYGVVCIYGAILLLHGLINVLNVRWFSWLGNIAALWNILGVVMIGAFLLALLPRQKASSVFSNFNQDSSTGIHSKPYTFLLGLLMSQYTLLAYDSAAHMSEETKTADKTGGYGIIGAVLGSVLLGTIYLLPLVFTSIDVPHLLDPGNDTKGYAIAQLLYNGFESHFHDARWSFLLLIIPCGGLYFCGLLSVTTTSRMTYAFSRDGALPLSRFWHKLNGKEVPGNAVFLCIVVAFCLALPYLASEVAFQATLSISTIAFDIAYGLPILLRVTGARHNFVPGPLHLGRFSLVIGWLAVGWVMVSTILFCLPVAYPVTIETLNYAPVALGGVSMFTLGYWFLSGRHWFQGPVPNIGSVET
ncbi:amino-acid permease BAT1-like [Selaginella moellendorffii]|uniref:amino-acid permease BAT1-like n=1 Tax=Selaginella moellendorffii TaxID=88036 RepID=UPI000D1C5AF5|nr:amino-acid permease BAT1-like [Selaginella moellendorffii]|eukprot:XP_024532240.1 amino-acid permease BAT1-like [Selaginella moellendorffii]